MLCYINSLCHSDCHCKFQCRYDLKDTSKLVLQDTFFLCAMAPPGGGRNVVSPRFMRHFMLIGITPFNDDTMTRIFGTLLVRYARVSAYIPHTSLTYFLLLMLSLILSLIVQ